MAELTNYHYVPHHRTRNKLDETAAGPGSPVVLVSWISQTFLQLVLLSVIIVGQNILSAAADKRAEATYKDADAVLHEAVKIQEHLLAQDTVLKELVGKLAW